MQLLQQSSCAESGVQIKAAQTVFESVKLTSNPVGTVNAIARIEKDYKQALTTQAMQPGQATGNVWCRAGLTANSNRLVTSVLAAHMRTQYLSVIPNRET